MRYLLILIMFLSGCAIPIKMTTQISSKDIEYQEMVYQRNRNKIIQIRPYKNKQKTIITALTMEVGNRDGFLSEPQAMNLWKDYKNSNCKSLESYLIETNPYFFIDKIYKSMVKNWKERTKILKQKRIIKKVEYEKKTI